MFYMVDSFLRRNKDRFYHNGYFDYGIGADAAIRGKPLFLKYVSRLGKESHTAELHA